MDTCLEIVLTEIGIGDGVAMIICPQAEEILAGGIVRHHLAGLGFLGIQID